MYIRSNNEMDKRINVSKMTTRIARIYTIAAIVPGVSGLTVAEIAANCVDTNRTCIAPSVVRGTFVNICTQIVKVD